MKFIIPLLCLVAVINAAPQQSQQPQFNYANYLQSQTTTPAPPIHPPASIHYVNIGQELNGDYKFGYDTGKGPSGQSFREETRLPDGTVKGQYGYLDAANKMRIVKYSAGATGFNIESDTALNEQQIAASRPSAPAPAQEQPRPQYQPSQYSPRQSFQGLGQAAQSVVPQYLPAPNSAQAQQPYSGQPSLPQYSPSAYGNAQQLTPAQLQQQALAAARARQAALARQQQQEAIIRQQQQAATEQILAHQRAALEAQQADAAQRQNQQNSYQGLAAQYAAAQPQPQQQYQPAPQPQQQYQPAPQPQQQYQPAPQPQPQPQQAPPTYQSPQYQPASYSQPRQTVNELKPDVLSQFIQLPGTRLIQIDKPRAARPASSSLLSSSSTNKKDEEDTYSGPVVINAALLNYDIGSTKLPEQSANRNNKKA